MKAVLVFLLMMAAGCGESPRPVVSNGAALFRENGCATCHGARGRGDGPSARGTAIHPRNLSDRNSYRNGASAEAIARTIAGGIRNADGSGMPAFAHIPADERRAIAEFIVTLQRRAGVPPALREAGETPALLRKDKS